MHIMSRCNSPAPPLPPLRPQKLEIAVVRLQHPITRVGFGHDAHRDDFTGLFAEKAPVVRRDVAGLFEPLPQILPPVLDGDDLDARGITVGYDSVAGGAA